MKTQRYLLLLSIICLSLLLVKCGKDGAIGPQGDAGDKGTTGLQGPVGPAGPKGVDGSDGSIIYSGKSVPVTATGKAGDFYLDTSTGLLYGPKTAAGWGTGVSLKGPAGVAGAAGAAGSKTLSGAGAPAAALGSNGDFYLDKSNYLLYGPKADAGWGTAVNLRGPAGPAGSANVIYADWIKPTAYKKDTVFETYHFYYDIAASKITQAILDNGTVIVYARLNGYNTLIWPVNNVAALPIILNYKFATGGITYTDTWSAITSVGKIRIDFVNNNNFYNNIATTHSFRYVIIPGGMHTASVTHTNFNNYAEVKQVFNLTD